MTKERNIRRLVSLKSLNYRELTLEKWISEVRERVGTLLVVLSDLVALMIGRCEGCEKPDSFLWLPVGDHAVCDRLTHDDVDIAPF